MRPLFLPLISSVLSLIGCFNPNAPIRTAAGNLTQAQVDAIIEKCGGPPGMAMIKNNQLTINRAPDILVTGCVLDALQATGQTTLPKVSVGNQRYEMPGKRNSS